MKHFALILVISSCAFAQAVSISAPVFAGSGLNDASSGGAFSLLPTNAAYQAVISATGSPDHFTWAKNGGTMSSAISITGGTCVPVTGTGWQTLTDGVKVCWLFSTGHTLAASWTINANARGSAAGVNTIQTGVDARMRTAESKLRDWRSVIDYGADPTGVNDSFAAFTACYAANDFCMAPDGLYSLSAMFVVARSNSGFACQSTAGILQYTGTSAVAAAVMVGSLSGPYNLRLDNCTVRGNTHTAAAVEALQANHSSMNSLRLKDATTGLFIKSVVSSAFRNIEVSAASGAYVVTPDTGIDVLDSNTILIDWPTVEYIGNRAGGYAGGTTGIGIHARGGTVSLNINGGTTESNRIGTQFDSTTTSNSRTNGDDEDNTYADLYDLGVKNRVEGGLLSGSGTSHDSVRYGASAVQGSVSHILGSRVTIDSGAKGIVAISNNLGNNNGPPVIVNNGTGTTSLDNWNCCGGGFGPLVNSLAGDTGLTGTLGFATTPALVTDDPNGYIPSFQAYSSFFKMGTGPGENPTCDVTYGHGDLWYFKGSTGVTGQLRTCIKDGSNVWAWRQLYYDSGVAAGTYGDSGHVAQVTVDAGGKITSAGSVAINSALITTSGTISGGGLIAPGGTLNLVGSGCSGHTSTSGSFCTNAGCTTTGTVTYISSITCP